MALKALLAVIVCTYFPVIFTWVPVLGQLKLVLVSGVVLVVAFGAGYQTFRNQTVYSNPVVTGWIGFLLILMLGTFVSYDQGLTFSTFLASLKMFLIFVVMIKIADSAPKLRAILATFTLSAIGMGLNTMYNFVFATNTLTSGYHLDNAYRGIALKGGIFGDPNDLALFFNSAMPFAVYFVLVNRRKLLPTAGVLVLIVGTVLTYSRAGFLGLCLIGVLYMALFGVRAKAFLALASISLVLWTAAPASYRDRLSSIMAWQVDEETGKTGTRMDSWKAAIPVGLEHPILGVGAGSGTYVNGEIVSDWHAVHNAFVQVLVETGMLGFFAYLSLFAIPLTQYRRHFRPASKTAPELTTLFRLTLVSLGAFACTAFFTPNAYSPLLFMLTGFAVITLELSRRMQTESRATSPQSRPHLSTVRVAPLRPLPSSFRPSGTR